MGEATMSIALLRDDYDERLPLLRPIAIDRQSVLTLPTPSRPSSNAATTNDLDRSTDRVWYVPLVEALGQLGQLQQGWAGPGTTAPSMELLLTALFLMTATAQPTTKPPTVVPMVDGRVQLVWYDAGLELEIIVDLDGQATASVYDLASGIEEDDLNVSDPRVAEAVRRLSSS
jgi:hypothetical protein